MWAWQGLSCIRSHLNVSIVCMSSVYVKCVCECAVCVFVCVMQKKRKNQLEKNQSKKLAHNVDRDNTQQQTREWERDR